MHIEDMIDRLRTGVTADIWYDAHAHSDKAAEALIDETQAAMMAAALLLETYQCLLRDAHHSQEN